MNRVFLNAEEVEICWKVAGLEFHSHFSRCSPNAKPTKTKYLPSRRRTAAVFLIKFMTKVARLCEN